MPPQTDSISSPQALDYGGPGSPQPARVVAQSVEAWSLRELKAREMRAWVWKSLILLAVAGVMMLQVYLWTTPHGVGSDDDPEDKTLYDFLDPQ